MCGQEEELFSTSNYSQMPSVAISSCKYPVAFFIHEHVPITSNPDGSEYNEILCIREGGIKAGAKE